MNDLEDTLESMIAQMNVILSLKPTHNFQHFHCSYGKKFFETGDSQNIFIEKQRPISKQKKYDHFVGKSDDYFAMYDTHFAVTTVFRLVNDEIIKIVDIPSKVKIFSARGEWILCDIDIFRIDL